MKMMHLSATSGLLLGLAPTQMQAAPLTLGTYYEDVESVSCSAGVSCYVYFKDGPAKNFLTISNISCHIRSNTLIPASVRLYAQGTPSRFEPLPTEAHLVNNRYTTDFNIPIKFKVGPGVAPGVGVDFEGVNYVTMDCTITGSLSTS